MRNEYYHFSVVNRLFYRALHVVVICVLLFVGTMPLSAQIFSTAQGNRYETSYPSEYGGMQQSPYATQDAQMNYNAYQSTVYQPFESSVPSDNNPVYSNSQGENDGYNAPTNRRNLTGGGDPGDQEPTSPVGEAWVMLLFAAVAALVVFVRQRKAVLRG